ncbi:hypothetical protein PPYR_10374 [Photinus pyralis]|uniref:Uncharacterized protein n=1 Tax=Photinus pyralis TaxID=7054 RepID=A0A5N4AG84_PHOPY|nr:hypothetical protein PPYR_10374 [Photinus pyralis]
MSKHLKEDMSTEDLKALKAHGYVFDSDSVSGGSKSDFDDDYYALKPDPVLIDPSLYTIVSISCRTQELNPSPEPTRKTQRSFSKRGKRGNRPITRASDSQNSSVSKEWNTLPSCYTIDPPCFDLADKENVVIGEVENVPLPLVNTPRNVSVANKKGKVVTSRATSTSSQRRTSLKKENVSNNFAVSTVSQRVSERALTPPYHKITLPTSTTNTQNVQRHTVRSSSSNLNTGARAPRNTNSITTTSAPSHRTNTCVDIPYRQMRNNSTPPEENVSDCPGCCCCQ